MFDCGENFSGLFLKLFQFGMDFFHARGKVYAVIFDFLGPCISAGGQRELFGFHVLD